ncbi:protein phosphatase 2C domain-containing protein [Streptomyces sp. NPDC091267]|uniref:protein phosphatase 2C domain-containing protein n=1 Tax=Streptomyces sp. NPDC091267 TaxID=3155195 RepID=UPI00342A9DD4
MMEQEGPGGSGGDAGHDDPLQAVWQSVESIVAPGRPQPPPQQQPSSQQLSQQQPSQQLSQPSQQLPGQLPPQQPPGGPEAQGAPGAREAQGSPRVREWQSAPGVLERQSAPEHRPVCQEPAPAREWAPAPEPAPAPERRPAGAEPAPPLGGPFGESAGEPVGELLGEAVSALGEPRHSGKRPPSYAPVPQGLPSAGEGPAAAVLPDIVVDGAAYGPLTVRAASVRGDSHRYLGEPRQDALCVTRIGTPGTGEMLLLAVADGVGSAARSHVGSNQVCRLATVYLDRVAQALLSALRADDLPAFTELADEAVGRIAVLLADLAMHENQKPEAYATTLRVLLVPLDPAVRTRGFLAVGDGGTALLRAGAWHLDVTKEEDPDGSGMIDTRTAALPLTRTAVARLLAPAMPGDVLVLCTDGLSTPLAGDQEMRDFLRAAWGGGAVPGPVDFLWQTQFRVKSYDDDRSAVVLWEGPA